ncbi:MAG: flavodoxin family protein [Clostridiales bacterium]|nr:flavodoxin family protein [Clostridiales bacterium]
MKILVLESSPHINGSSNLLAENFVRGAKEAGNSVTVFDVARANIHPCLACEVCGMNGPCSQNDDMGKLKELILQSDLVVFVTPLYYFGMSAPLKIVIDRCYSFNSKLHDKDLKTALIATSWDSNEVKMRPLEQHYQMICHYLGFKDKGMIIGLGCGTPSMTQKTIYPQKAYELGKAIK